ncbi:MAG: glycosyltransferase family 39 protein [Ignavibacteriales bacterium]|nr:MAG: glycosyltransferase family 39 protein [Ignavibacteriales bacterium]
MTKKNKLILLISAFAFIKLLIHLYTNAFAGYGIFRDELYYLSCASRPDIGYVDQPPFSIWVLTVTKSIIGDSVFAIRLIPALISAILVFITGLITKRFGGQAVAISIACTAVILSPIVLGMNSIYSMNTFDHLFWGLGFYFMLKLVDENKQIDWIILGVIMGIALLNKIGFLWFAAGLFISILLTKDRVKLKTFSPWLAAITALIIFSPFVIWNFLNDFAHIEFIRNASLNKYSGLTPVDFILGQILLQNPYSILIWLPGLYYLFFHPAGKKYKAAGIIYLTAFIILVINWHSKAEYLAAAYPVLFAAGGVFWEKLEIKKNIMWIRYALLIPLILSGLLTLPLALPILSVETYIKYADAIGMSPSSPESKELAELPQFYADMFGWEDLAKSISEVYESLPVEDKNDVVVFAPNYGVAGAVEYFSKKYLLPEVISPHNNFWIWGYGDRIANTIIVVGGNEIDHYSSCAEVYLAKIHQTKYAMPYENNRKIFVCKGLFVPPQKIWEREKNFE